MKDIAKLILFVAIISVAAFKCTLRGKDYLPHHKVRITLEKLPEGIEHGVTYLSDIELISDGIIVPFTMALKDSEDSQYYHICESLPEGEYTVILTRLFAEPVITDFTLESDTTIRIEHKKLARYKKIEHLKVQYLFDPPKDAPAMNYSYLSLTPKITATKTGRKLLQGSDIPVGDTIRLVYLGIDYYQHEEENIKIVKNADGSYFCKLVAAEITRISPVRDQQLLCELLDFQNNCIEIDYRKDRNQWHLRPSHIKTDWYYWNLGNEVMVFSGDNNLFYSAYYKFKENLRLTDATYSVPSVRELFTLY